MKPVRKDFATTKRLFVGFFLNEEWRKKFNKYQQAFPALRGLVWTAPHNLHSTILFLGHMPKAKLPLFQTAINQIAQRHEPFILFFDCFRQAPPNSEAPSMIWAQYKMQGEFELLAHDIKKAFMSLTVFDEENKKIIPHVTLARMKNMPVLENIDVSMKERGMMIDEICLVEASGSGDSAKYSIIQRYPLGKIHEKKEKTS